MAPTTLAPTSFFDRWSATYDSARLQASTYAPIHNEMIRRLDGEPFGVLLDLGCGTGQLLDRLHRRFPSIGLIGVDYSPGMLAAAEDRLGPEVALGRADAQRLPLADASVDVITCSESFHWYPDQVLALGEMARVLRPGGRLLLASIATVTGAGDDVLRVVTAAGGRPVQAPPPHRLRRLLRSSGFTVEHQRRLPRRGFVPWPIFTAARLHEPG